MSTTLPAPAETDHEIEYRTLTRFPGYRFGSDGTVWSAWLQRRGGSIIGQGWRLLRPRIEPRGYMLLSLKQDNGSTRTPFQVHRLILEAFRGPCPTGCQARHFPDGDKTNNAIGNLAWGTAKQNIGDKWAQGTVVIGERHHSAILTEPIVREMRAMRASGKPIAEIARHYGVSWQSANDSIKGITWSWVK